MTTPTPSSVWIVCDKEGDCLFASEHKSIADDHFQHCVDEESDFRAGPYTLTEYVPKRDLAAAQSQIEMLRNGDTCARHCEGTAYRIEARRLAHDLAAAQEALRVAEEELRENEGMIAVWRGALERAEALAESLKAEKEAAVAQERERCAKVCERYAGEHFEERADECAAAIRRGE